MPIIRTRPLGVAPGVYRSLLSEWKLEVLVRSLPVVSVVMAVYDAQDHLEECLDSLFGQSIGEKALEVVAVDDGSQDRTLDILARWAERHPGLVVERGPRTGAPGGPRNRGIELSRGEFLFFADPDDVVGHEGLERMVAAARTHGTDVVLGRIRGVGRTAPTRPFERSVGRGSVTSTNAIWSLTAQKLFRRELLDRHRLRFAEGARLAEEQPLVVPAYFLADGISVVADYDCYHLMERRQGRHLTDEPPDPLTFLPIVRSSVETVLRHTGPGPEQDALVGRFAQVELSGKFSRRFLDLPPQTQQAFLSDSAAILHDLVPERVDLSLPLVNRLRLALVRRGSVGGLRQLAAAEVSGCLPRPVTRDGSVFMPLAGLDDPSFAIPPEYFDVTDRPAVEYAPGALSLSGAGPLEVSWPPPGVQLPPGAAWSIELRCRDRLVELAAEHGVAVVDDEALEVGIWSMTLRLDAGGRVHSGRLRASPGDDPGRPALPAHWLGGKVTVGSGGDLWLTVRDPLEGRRGPVLARASWDGRRLIRVEVPPQEWPRTVCLRLAAPAGERVVPLRREGDVLVGVFDPRALDLGVGRWALSLSAAGPDRVCLPLSMPAEDRSGRLLGWRRLGRRAARVYATGGRRRVVVRVADVRWVAGRAARKLGLRRAST